jgi:hypothetical protein
VTRCSLLAESTFNATASCLCCLTSYDRILRFKLAALTVQGCCARVCQSCAYSSISVVIAQSHCRNLSCKVVVIISSALHGGDSPLLSFFLYVCVHILQAQSLAATHSSTAAHSNTNTGRSSSSSGALSPLPLQTDVSRQLSGLSARIRAAAAVHNGPRGSSSSRPGSTTR